MAVLFNESERSDPVRPVLDPNFEAGDARFWLAEPKQAYARLAVMGPQREAVHQLLSFSGRRGTMRLHLLFTLNAEQLDARAEVSRIAVRYGMLLSDSAGERSDRVLIHGFVDAPLNRLLVVFQDVFVDTPSLSLAAFGVWFTKPLDDTTARLVPNRAPLDLQPFNTGRYQLPTTGGLAYVCSCGPDGAARNVPLDAIIRDACDPYPGEERRSGETRARLLIKPFQNYRVGLRVCDTFKALARACQADAAGHGRDNSADEHLAAERAHQIYLERLERSQEGVIDLGDTEWVWSPSMMVAIRNRILEELVKDQNEGYGSGYLFTNTRAFLNRLFARSVPPRETVWIKSPKSDHEAEGATLQESTVSKFVKETKDLFLHWPAPRDPEQLFSVLHGKVAVNKEGNFSLIEWYMKFGARQVQGPRFWPMCHGETLLDAHHRDHINTFAGFRCQRWLRDSKEECEQALRHYAHMPRDRPDNHLEVLRRHILNICCGDPHTFTAHLTWLALLCFYPSLKPPTAFINKGPPGCGKSSLTEMICERLLNKIHMRKVTKLDQIVGRFNAITERIVLTVVEELDFKMERQAALNALNGTRRRTECLW